MLGSSSSTFRVASARWQARTLAEPVEPFQEAAMMTMASETPTIVLVHGAWADATGFGPEIRALPMTSRHLRVGNQLSNDRGER